MLYLVAIKCAFRFSSRFDSIIICWSFICFMSIMMVSDSMVLVDSMNVALSFFNCLRSVISIVCSPGSMASTFSMSESILLFTDTR